MVNMSTFRADELLAIPIIFAAITAGGALLAGVGGIYSHHRLARFSANPTDFDK